jgi:hypothetical protein
VKQCYGETKQWWKDQDHLQIKKNRQTVTGQDDDDDDDDDDSGTCVWQLREDM